MLQSGLALHKHVNMKYKPYVLKQLKTFSSGCGARKSALSLQSAFMKVCDLRCVRWGLPPGLNDLKYKEGDLDSIISKVLSKFEN